VGLTLKKYDEFKDRFWMADYRFLTFPDKNKKYNIFTVLAMLKQGLKPNDISSHTKVRVQIIDELNTNYQKGLKDEKRKLLKDFQSNADKMKNDLWG
jgi:hypothetical protein